jgi:Glycosyl transferase family 2
MRAARGERMMPDDKTPLFSIIIPTRDRSSSFAVALQSVLDQRCGKLELVVVNDGSSEEHERRYRELLLPASRAARILALPHSERGTGRAALAIIAPPRPAELISLFSTTMINGPIPST